MFEEDFSIMCLLSNSYWRELDIILENSHQFSLKEIIGCEGLTLIPHDDLSWNILAEASVDGGLCPSADSREDTDSRSQLSCLQASSVCQADVTQSGLTNECSSCFSTCNVTCNKLAAGVGVTRCSSIHWLQFLPTTSAFLFFNFNTYLDDAARCN